MRSLGMASHDLGGAGDEQAGQNVAVLAVFQHQRFAGLDLGALVLYIQAALLQLAVVGDPIAGEHHVAEILHVAFPRGAEAGGGNHGIAQKQAFDPVAHVKIPPVI